MFKFDHIAFGIPRISACTQFLVGVLGGRPFEGGDGPNKLFRGVQYAFRSSERLELIEPGENKGFLHGFVEKRGSGVHHVTFTVPNLSSARQQVERAGFSITGLDESRSGWKEFFIHPKQAHGVLVQFAEHDEHGEGNWSADSDLFSQPAPSTLFAQPARILGLVLVTRNEAAARRLWEAAAGGRCEHRSSGGGDASELVFRWSESPLRLRVLVDADASVEGPVGLDVAVDDERPFLQGTTMAVRPGRVVCVAGR